MADLLGSILGSMEKPPTVDAEQKKKAKAHQKQLEKFQDAEKQKLQKFKVGIQSKVEDILKDASIQKHKFEPMDKVSRSIVHEVAEVAGLTSFSFGQEEEERYVMVWKKECAPCDDELNAYKRGEEWNAEEAKQKALQKQQEEAEEKTRKRTHEEIVPKTNYKEKYQHLIGTTAAKEAAEVTTTNKSYGFVPSENKKDLRTIEQVMADSRAKRQKIAESSESNQP